MTLEERMKIIDKKVENDIETKRLNEINMKNKEESCKQQIRSLKERIKDVIDLINYGYGKGVISGNRDSLTYFKSEGIYHRVGLMPSGKHLGIMNGGACGSIDFYTDGDEIFGFKEGKNPYVYDNLEYRKTDPRLCDMRSFVDEFDDFEKRLYSYIDSLATV